MATKQNIAWIFRILMFIVVLFFISLGFMFNWVTSFVLSFTIGGLIIWVASLYGFIDL